MHTPPPFADIQDLPLDTDDALRDRVAMLIDRAARRQFWLMFLDDRCCQLPVVIPSAIPRRPGRGHTENLSRFLGDVVEEVDAESVVFVLERPGPDELTDSDREWLTLAAAASRDAGVRLRGPLLCFDGGLRWIGPEDIGQI